MLRIFKLSYKHRISTAIIVMIVNGSIIECILVDIKCLCHLTNQIFFRDTPPFFIVYNIFQEVVVKMWSNQEPVRKQVKKSCETWKYAMRRSGRNFPRCRAVALYISMKESSLSNKTNELLTYVTGPYRHDEINYDLVYRTFLEEKKMWDKDTGRMYAHNIISWHKDEQITPEQAFEFGKEFAEKWFSGFQTLVAVHKDKEHIHCHLVTNSVSYEDGRKLHNTRKDLERIGNKESLNINPVSSYIR